MVSRLAAVSSFVSISIIVACGSSSEDDLYTKKPGGGGTDASVGGAAGTSGASNGGDAGSAGNAGQDAGMTGGSAGARVDAGRDATPDASGGTGGTGGTSGVGTGKCGNMTCAFVAEDFCCKPSNAAPYCANDSVGNECSCSGTFCNTVDIHCDGPEDCENGEICCADTGFTGGEYDVVECRQTCEQPFPVGGPQWEVCHLGGAPCKKGSCAADSGLPPGYGTCK